jgi:hypothetical protein
MKTESGGQQGATVAHEFSAAIQIARALASLSPEARKRVLARALQQAAQETASVNAHDR